MNVNFNTALGLNQLQEDAVRAQAAVVTIIDRESHLNARLEELVVLPKAERLEEAVKLVLEVESLAEIHKILKDQITRVQKRIEDIGSSVRAETLKEVKKGDKDEYDTASFILKVKQNPPKVNVIDESKVPKDFRRQPPPVPHWKKWAPDKNAIKKALKEKTKRSIAGVELIREEKLDIVRK